MQLAHSEEVIIQLGTSDQDGISQDDKSVLYQWETKTLEKEYLRTERRIHRSDRDK